MFKSKILSKVLRMQRFYSMTMFAVSQFIFLCIKDINQGQGRNLALTQIIGASNFTISRYAEVGDAVWEWEVPNVREPYARLGLRCPVGYQSSNISGLVNTSGVYRELWEWWSWKVLPRVIHFGIGGTIGGKIWTKAFSYSFTAWCRRYNLKSREGVAGWLNLMSWR